MRYDRLSLLLLLLTGAAFGQIDNRYCTPGNTWVGTNADNPAILDGPASLPTACFNTDPKYTPSPGPVVTVNITQSLQAAYSAAACGTTIRLSHGGVWNDPFDFPAKNCDDQHWITITTDGNVPPPGYRIAPSSIPEMAQLKIARSSGVISFGDHLHFIGIYWQKNTLRGGILYMFAQMRDANKVIFDRNLFRGNPHEDMQHGIMIQTANYIAVIDSWFDDFHCLAKVGACSDAQAISGGTGAVGEDITASGPVKIVNNYLEASTENILFGGARANGPGPNDVEIRRNYLYKPMSWNPADPSYIGDPAYVVKNCFELKNGSRILVEGNVCENVWGGYTQRGYAILLTPMNQQSANTPGGVCPRCEVSDITLRYNVVHTAAGFITVTSGPSDAGDYSMGQHRVSIHDNVADNLQYGETCYGCGYMLMQVASPYNPKNPPPEGGVTSDITIDHNTILAAGKVPSPQPRQAYAMISISSVPPNVDTPRASNISFQNNIASTLDAGLYSSGGDTNNCANLVKPSIPSNLWQPCFAGTSPFTNNVLIEYPLPITNWPAGNLFAPSMKTVGFHDYGAGVYSLPQDSPYFGKGANLDAVNLAIFGVREEAREAPTKTKAKAGKRVEEEGHLSLWGEIMLTLHFVLLILAGVLFFAAALHIEHPRVSFLPLGLCLWVLAILVGR